MNGKKLYKIKNGAMITGVCNGVAAYFNVDVSLVRLAAVLLACFTGVGIVAYIAAAVILPELYDAPYDNMSSGGMNNGNMNNTNYGGMNDQNMNNMNGAPYGGAASNPENTNENGKDII